MTIKIINKSDNDTPKYATEGSAGFDIQANLDCENIIIEPMQRVLIPTGLFMEIPQGYEAQLRARSGLAIKNGLTLINGVGTIDSDYRGEIKVLIINLSNEVQTISHGERIAQIIIAKYEKGDLQEVEELTETDRGTGGFGSTGV